MLVLLKEGLHCEGAVAKQESIDQNKLTGI